MIFGISYLMLWILVIFLLLLVLGILGETRRLRAIGGSVRLLSGSIAPPFSAVDSRTRRTISNNVRDGSYLMIFVSPGCGECQELVRSMSKLDTDKFVVISRGDTKAAGVFLEQLPTNTPVLLDPHGEIAEEYGISRYPHAVAVNRGRIHRYLHPQTAAELGELRDSLTANVVLGIHV
jgi:peroxiredoxin